MLFDNNLPRKIFYRTDLCGQDHSNWPMLCQPANNCGKLSFNFLCFYFSNCFLNVASFHFHISWVQKSKGDSYPQYLQNTPSCLAAAPFPELFPLSCLIAAAKKANLAFLLDIFIVIILRVDYFYSLLRRCFFSQLIIVFSWNRAELVWYSEIRLSYCC